MKKNEIQKQSVLYGVIGLLVGVLLTVFIATVSVNTNNKTMMGMMGMRTDSGSNHGSMSMDEMSKQLENKSGDEFDKAFIEMMIAHHQGAIDMANLIPARAKHDEIKKLGEAIISAQTKEIKDMQQWQRDWGYSATEVNQMMHGGH